MAFREIINGGKPYPYANNVKCDQNIGACNADGQQSAQINQNPFKNFINYMVTGKATMRYNFQIHSLHSHCLKPKTRGILSAAARTDHVA